MEKIKLKLYEWIIFFLLLIFLIGYMGLFSLMSNYISDDNIFGNIICLDYGIGKIYSQWN